MDLYSIDAEQQVLASIIVKNDNILETIDILKPKDFFREQHKVLYGAMINLYMQNKPIDHTTIMDYFKGDLSAIGGYSTLANLLNGGLSHLNKAHIEIVKVKSNERKLRLLLQEKLQEIGQKKFDELLYDLEEKSLGLVSNNENEYITEAEMMKKTIEKIETNFYNKSTMLGLGCDIKGLDLALKGFQKEMLYTIAGRPSMGKSALALNIIQEFSKSHTGLFYSQEMNEFQLGTRKLMMRSFIDGTRLKTGNLEDKEWQKIVIDSAYISNGKCLTCVKPSVHCNEIYAKSKKLKLKDSLDYIMIDHLGLMDVTGMGPDIRQQTTNIMKRLKQIAKELDVPVIVLSQLSREVEKRADKRPMLSDLKESAGVEENSDIVLLLYRDEYYNKDTNDKNIIEVNVAKQRDGKTGITKLAWIPEYQRVADILR